MKSRIILALLLTLGAADSLAFAEEKEDCCPERKILISLSIQNAEGVPDDSEEKKKVFFNVFLFPDKLNVAVIPGDGVKEIQIDESAYRDFENYLAQKLSELAPLIVNEREIKRGLNHTYCWIDLMHGDRNISAANVFDKETLEEIVRNIPSLDTFGFHQEKLEQILEQVGGINSEAAPQSDTP
ncbi:hypothetical protein DDZ13_13060 [Coraliomargarita sinensis]|uniref:Uncharacterized protein n=1 Tax=Coraliomargarita sinensis TaxID=2174842 RepID=A0A317ZDN5_9BACT|nr:hypothetical protein [Coraliomargarita sinensis]PXA03346.1 hypothetical protein DDZ13_13060 [Coraliomargarita sinensis]